MAEQGVPLKGLFGGEEVGLQDMLSSAQLRKKASRSPLRARACGLQQQQSSDNMINTEDSKPKTNSLKSRSASPDAAKHVMMMQSKKKEEGSAPYSSSYNMSNVPTFISKPTTPRDRPSSDKPRPPRAHHDWERIVADGKESNDGTHLIRLLADFIEEFQFGCSNIGNGEYASWVNDPKSFPVENRHSHQLAGQLRRLADVFEKQNICSSFKEKRVK